MTQATKRKTRARKSYEDRTGFSTRAAKLLIYATFTKPATIEDEDGNVMRVWTGDDWRAWTSADLRSVLKNRVAVERNEMLGTVPPAAIAYSLKKQWLVPVGTSGLHLITLKCAIELDLPMRFRRVHNGRKIPFISAKKG